MKLRPRRGGSIPPAASRRQLATVKKLDGAARHTDYRLDMENHFNGYLAPRLVAVWGNTKVTTTCRTREVWAPSGRGRCRGPSVSPYLPPSSPPPLSRKLGQNGETRDGPQPVARLLTLSEML